MARAARPERPPTTLPGWATDGLDPSARVGLVLTAPLALLVAIDAFTAGRPEVSGGPLGLALLGLVAASVGLVQLHRGAVLALLLSGSVLAATSTQRPALAVAFVVCALAVVATALWPRARVVALVAGLFSLAGFAPLALDGVLAKPALGAVLSSGEPLRAPLVDQATGLQLPVATPSIRVTSTAPGTTRLHDAALGIELGLHALPRDRALASAMTDAQLWLEAQGLSRVSMGEPVDQRGLFDVATEANFTALSGRAHILGIVRVAVLGNETFAIAAWAREHRQPSLEASARPLIEQAFFRAPLRPRLSAAIREAVTPTVVTTIDGAITGVRVSVGNAVVLVLPASVPVSTQRLLSTQGPFPVQLAEGTVTNGVRLVVLGGGAGVPLRRSQLAPTFTRVVRVADGFSGGWLTDAPGPERRALDLSDTRTGPVFDLDGKLVGFAVNDTNGLELVTTDTLETTFTRIVGRPTALESATLAQPPPLFEVASPIAPAPEADASSLSHSVVLARSTAGVTAAVVVGTGESGWALVADASIAPPGATVSITLPSEEVRGVDVVRTTGRVVLLRAPRVEGDDLQVLKLMDAIPEGSTRRVAWGFREDPSTSMLALKSVHGELSPDGFDADPAPVMTGGPVLTPEGRVAALRVGVGQSITSAPKIQALSVAGVSDVFWRVVAEPTGECQLAARVMLEDPLEEATAVRVRLEPASSDSVPARLKVAALTDALPKKGLAEIGFRLPCWTKPQWMQFEVQSPGAVRATKVQRVPVITTLPGTLAGRAGATEGSARPPSSEITWLWELPPRVSMQHACRLKPAECERACYVDELDACVLDGRHALSVGEVARALGRLDPLCANGDVEACTLLAWAVAEKKSGRQPKAKVELVLQPWCDAGNERACAALAPTEWKKQLESLKKACAPNSGRCGALGRHLLLGPRLDADVKAALGHLKLACGEGDVQACAESATESVRFERESLLEAMPRATAACRGKQAAGCLLEALNAARGLTVPRTPQAAEKIVAETCAAGSEAACLMDLRP